MGRNFSCEWRGQSYPYYFFNLFLMENFKHTEKRENNKYIYVNITDTLPLLLLLLLFCQSWHTVLSTFLSRFSEIYQMWYIPEERFMASKRSHALCLLKACSLLRAQVKGA